VVAPLRLARGLQNKVLEALAMGKATVVSPEALEGLKGPEQVPALMASTDQEWIEATSELLDNAEHRKELGARGRRYVQERYSWDKNLAQLVDLLGMRRPDTAESKEPRNGDNTGNGFLALAGGGRP
jgi:glycosyltransferase involved in cell wall biosynthesis